MGPEKGKKVVIKNKLALPKHYSLHDLNYGGNTGHTTLVASHHVSRLKFHLSDLTFGLQLYNDDMSIVFRWVLKADNFWRFNRGLTRVE